MTEIFICGGMPFMKFLSAALLAVLLVATVAAPKAQAANIIQIADNPTSCGGAVLCSFDGTLGYTGTQAFNLSTINSWFQIDVTTPAVSYFSGQPAEPKGGAGHFLVVNDTGHIVTNLSLTLTDTFTQTTAGNVGSCDHGGGCQTFQIHDGAMHAFSTVTLAGVNCVSDCGTASA